MKCFFSFSSLRYNIDENPGNKGFCTGTTRTEPMYGTNDLFFPVALTKDFWFLASWQIRASYRSLIRFVLLLIGLVRLVSLVLSLGLSLGLGLPLLFPLEALVENSCGKSIHIGWGQ